MLATKFQNLIKGLKKTFYLPNTFKELKESPKSAKIMGVFLITGILIYYFLMGDF